MPRPERARLTRVLLGACIGLGACTVTATTPSAAPATALATNAAGSTAFCLYELPARDGRRQWVNLGIVQYVELRADEVRLFFGGGNLGSGHERALPIASADQGLALIAGIQAAARQCR